MSAAPIRLAHPTPLSRQTHAGAATALHAATVTPFQNAKRSLKSAAVPPL
jgi:hypothetical protein